MSANAQTEEGFAFTPEIRCAGVDPGDRTRLADWVGADACLHERGVLALTLATREAVYWSRSRQSLWKKGETSGHIQKVKDILVDCDQDALILKIEQIGSSACHTGRESCFYRRLEFGRILLRCVSSKRNNFKFQGTMRNTAPNILKIKDNF